MLALLLIQFEDLYMSIPAHGNNFANEPDLDLWFNYWTEDGIVMSNSDAYNTEFPSGVPVDRFRDHYEVIRFITLLEECHAPAIEF